MKREFTLQELLNTYREYYKQARCDWERYEIQQEIDAIKEEITKEYIKQGYKVA